MISTDLFLSVSLERDSEMMSCLQAVHWWKLLRVLNFTWALDSQKTVAVRNPTTTSTANTTTTTILYFWKWLTIKDHQALAYLHIPRYDFLYPSKANDSLVSCLYKTPALFLFFERFLINEYFTYCSSLKKSIFLIIMCILSLTKDKPVRRWRRQSWIVGDAILQYGCKWTSWFYGGCRAGVPL